MTEFKAGSYVVIGDILTVKKGTGDNVSYERHRRGAVVKLTAAQAQAFAGGSRPMVRPAKEAAEEEQAETNAEATTNEENTAKSGKSTAKSSG